MISIAQRFEDLKSKAQKNEVVFIDRGVVDPTGGYFRKPFPDPEYNNQIPTLRLFYIPPGIKGQDRIAELNTNGWFKYDGSKPLTGVMTTEEKMDAMKQKMEAEIRASVMKEMEANTAKAAPTTDPLPEEALEPVGDALAAEEPKQEAPKRRRRTPKKKA